MIVCGGWQFVMALTKTMVTLTTAYVYAWVYMYIYEKENEWMCENVWGYLVALHAVGPQFLRHTCCLILQWHLVGFVFEECKVLEVVFGLWNDPLLLIVSIHSFLSFFLSLYTFVTSWNLFVEFGSHIACIMFSGFSYELMPLVY